MSLLVTDPRHRFLVAAVGLEQLAMLQTKEVVVESIAAISQNLNFRTH
jgi:hypothetical protein